jgi:hypothetical protein
MRNILFSILAGAVLAGCSTVGGSTREVRAPAGASSSARVASSSDDGCEPAPRETPYKAFH